MRVLFILKRGGSYGYPSPVPSSGLYNSIRFLVAMLRDRLSHEARMVVVADNNSIDREVTKFRPDIVVIEALWVVPSKFDVLKQLHPGVRWIVRIHSAMPFLAGEGNAIDWTIRYADRVEIAANDERTVDEIQLLLAASGSPDRTLYLPNYYPVPRRSAAEPNRRLAKRSPLRRSNQTPLDISCFGSIRPLKNQLTQAVAAVRYAEESDRPLRFHINGTRIEGGGEPVLKNLRSLFWHLPHKTLVEHPWMSHADFIRLVLRMDAGLQVSFSETFNIVAADHVAHRVPLVASKEVPWLAPQYAADPTDSSDIARKLAVAMKSRQSQNLRGLSKFSERSVQQWAALIARTK